MTRVYVRRHEHLGGAIVASVMDAEHGGALRMTEADVEELFAPVG